MLYLQTCLIFSQEMSLTVIRRFALRSIMDGALDGHQGPTHPVKYDDMTSSSFICSNCAEEEATLICEQLKTLFCDQCSQSFSFCIPCRSLLDFTCSFV